MKELSIEEKAKAYDKIIGIAKKELDACGSQDCDAARQIFRLFPELKESEDEKIRKEIISALKYANYKGVYDKHLAWLEKQATPQVRTGLEWVNTIDDACDKRYAEEYAHGEYCHEQSFKWGFQEGVDWLEKQCGQNHVNTPKFHEGDWIVHHGTENIYQVVAIIDNQYQLKYGDNYTVQKCADVDRCARLWDITKDAKDGDVLADNGTKIIFIFKNTEYDSHIESKVIKYFIRYSFDGINLPLENGGHLGVVGEYSNFVPATKEQREFLFQKMKDAGYTFDFEKKELKKIEQKPQRIVSAEAKEAMYDKTTWSEEDEYHKRQILRILKDNGCSRTLQERTEKWIEERLKSLRPQNTWKPSDAQMASITCAVRKMKESACYDSELVSLFNDLKKLKG